MKATEAAIACSRTRSVSVGILITLALACAFAARPATAAVVDSYCSPSGDVCTTVKKKITQIGARVVKLQIATFSFKGSYDLCVKPVGDRRECHSFRLSKHRHLYRDSVIWTRYFPEASGKQKATWRYSGDQIGPALTFHG